MSNGLHPLKVIDQMSARSLVVAGAFGLFSLCGCGIVPPKYNSNPEATMSLTTNSQYKVIMSGEITTYGGMPDTLGIRFPIKDRYTLVLYIITGVIEGEIPACDLRIGVAGDSPNPDVKGSVVFNGDKMEVKLQFPRYNGRGRVIKYEPFEFNGVYSIKMQPDVRHEPKGA